MARRGVRVATGLCGLAVVALFVAADLTGSALRHGYSMISQPISELVETGAPNKPFIDALLLAYHGLLIPFALGLHVSVAGARGDREGPALLALAGALGVLLTLFFPCDPGCAPLVSLRGTLHIVIAVPMGLAILFAILAFARRLAAAPAWGARYARHARISFAVGMALAVLTVALAESAWVGLLERLLTASYLQRYAVMGLALLRGAAGRTA